MNKVVLNLYRDIDHCDIFFGSIRLGTAEYDTWYAVENLTFLDDDFEEASKLVSVLHIVIVADEAFF